MIQQHGFVSSELIDGPNVQADLWQKKQTKEHLE